MKIFPAIDIKDKKCVRLVKGDFDNKTEYGISPIEQAGKYKEHGFKNLHVVDLDGALAGETVNLNIIKEINYLYTDVLSIDSTLLIPLSKTKSNNFIPYEMHIVSEGDTLWKIAKDYNLEVRDLARMNSIDEDSYLQLGQQLTIGNKNIHRNIESKKRTILYSVKQGDNLYKISDLFDVTIKSIKEINEFNDETLMPGQIIKIAIRAF